MVHKVTLPERLLKVLASLVLETTVSVILQRCLDAGARTLGRLLAVLVMLS